MAANMSNVAVYLSKANGAEVKPAPSLDSIPVKDDEVLVKNNAVASNPKDWKLSKWGMFEGIEGNDIAGVVEKVGKDVKEFKVGDRVGAFTYMARADQYGAYQPYTVASSALTFHIPNNVTDEQAATIPLAGLTAVVGLYDKLKLPEPTAEAGPASSGKDTPIIIWGGSSAVGVFAVQLAKISGFKIVAVAGSKNADYVKSLGADVVVDYKGKDESTLVNELVEAAQKISPGKAVQHVYDAISENGTTETLVKVLERVGKGGVITTVLPTQYDKSSESLPQNIKVDRTTVSEAYGNASALCSKFIRQLATWLGQGEFKPLNVRIVEGGLKGVPEGLKLLENGQVSAGKLVYRIADTK